MSEHKLDKGKEVIEWIVELGETLGYFVQTEYPVAKENKKNIAAVDVAWFSNQINNFPIFIFEIESRSSNAMANNPLKVFAQSNKQFEKPLFFFHIIIKGGLKSSRPKYLEAMYGKENYRIYLLEESNNNFLIEDIITQHSRVKIDFDYIDFYCLLQSELWKGKVDCSKLLKFASKLELSKENIIWSYICLSFEDEHFFKDLIDLFIDEANNNFENTKINTYIGENWLPPIIFSLLCGLSENEDEMKYWSLKLIDWQNRDKFLLQITAKALGMSRDYDEFIIGYAPQLITLCISLGLSKGNFQEVLINVLEEIVDKIYSSFYGLKAAIYLLHISTVMSMSNLYSKMRNYLLNFDYSNRTHIKNYDLEKEDEFILMFMKDRVFLEKSIKLNDFFVFCLDKYKNIKVSRKEIILRTIIDEGFVFEWDNILLNFLWSDQDVRD
ncbi:hypothetical protein ACRF8I_002765 [Acinetobacter baumannii]